MNVLVTGGAGFIGSWLVERLLNRGDHIWVVDDYSTSSPENLGHVSGHAHLTTRQLDIADSAGLAQVFADARPEICFHLAAQGSVTTSLRDPDGTFRSNVTGTQSVLEACRRHDVKLVHMGTCLQYDLARGQGGLSEDSPQRGSSPYSASKIAAEALVEGHIAAYGMPVVRLRPFNTYGPRQRSDVEGGVISIFANRIARDEPLRVFGDGMQTRDFLFVEDCVDFILQASADKAAEGRVLNAGTGVETRIRDLAHLMAGDRVPVEFIPHHHPQSEIPRLFCDSSFSRKLLGWEPRVSLEEGTRRVVAWAESRQGQEQV